MLSLNRTVSWRDYADGGAQAGLGQVAQVPAIDEDAPAGHVIEAEQQPRQGRLARPAVADHGQGLTGLDAEIKLMEDRALRLVMEVHALEADPAPAGSGRASGGPRSPVDTPRA